MSSWGKRQQVKYISTIVLLAIIIAALPIYYLFFHHTPSCFDNKQNGDETGVDCGGSCLKVCEAESLNPVVLYTRILQVIPSTYSAVTQVENPNANLYAEHVPYVFRVYDADNVQIASKEGETFIAPNSTFPIFEGRLDTGNKIPARISFEFSALPVWRKASSSAPVLNVFNTNLVIGTSSARLTAAVENPTPYDVKNVDLVALLYDADNNLVAASKTVVDSLSRHQSASLVFTWPQGFNRPVTKIDIVPEIPLEDFIPVKQ